MDKLKRIVAGSLMMFLISSAYAEQDWEQDAQIDKELGFINITWDISFVRTRSFNDLTKRIKKNFPPYTQQLEGAGEIIVEETVSEEPRVGYR